jgi:glycosyltransferase involved in cell wall biosynthesis
VSLSPTISIVIPTKNSATFLKDALLSLKKQTYQNYEVLLCDSNSCDATVKIAKNLLGEKIRIASEYDSCVPDALNKGFRFASGKIYGWLNSDDVLVSDCSLEKAFVAFQDLSADVIIGDSLVLDEAGIALKSLFAYGPRARTALGWGNVFTGSLFFSRDAWEQFGGFSCRYLYAFEYELIIFLFSHYTPYKLNTLLGGFRIHSGGLSSRFESKMSAELSFLLSEKNIDFNLFSKRFSLHRIIQHMRDRNLHKVVFSKVYDRNKGRSLQSF